MIQQAAAGEWVQIAWTVLAAGERAPQVPADTQSVPLDARVKGRLVAPGVARIGEAVTIRTVAGRIISGRLMAVNPPYTHGFGEVVPPILQAGLELREALSEGGRSDG